MFAQKSQRLFRSGYLERSLLVVVLISTAREPVDSSWVDFHLGVVLLGEDLGLKNLDLVEGEHRILVSYGDEYGYPVREAKEVR
jgi:hypothetical protein